MFDQNGNALGAPFVVSAVYFNAAGEIIGGDQRQVSCGCGVSDFEFQTGPMSDFANAELFFGGPASESAIRISQRPAGTQPTPPPAGTPEPSAPTEPPYVELQVSSGVWEMPPPESLSPGPYFRYAVVVENPNDTVMPGQAVVHINIFDGDSLVHSEDATPLASKLEPGEAIVLMGLTSPGRATRIETDIETSLWTTGESSNFFSDIGNVHVSQQADESVVVSATLRSSNGLGGPGMRAMAVYFDAANEIIGADELVFTHCGCGVTDIEIRSMPMPNFDRAKLFWSWPLAGQ